MELQVLLEKVESQKLVYIPVNLFVGNLINLKYHRKKILIVLEMILKCCNCRITFNKSATVSVYDDILIRNRFKCIN